MNPYSAALGATILAAVASTAAAAPIQWNTTVGGNGHWYELVTDIMTWDEARDDAESRTHMGLSGHLATITSDAENSFVYSLAGLPWTWIGAERIGTTQDFQWASGPEAGTTFYGPNAVSGSYANFNPGEPGTTETAVNTWINGYWNDLNKEAELPYVVEYSAATLAPVSLPASGLMLLAGFGLLALRRRKAA